MILRRAVKASTSAFLVPILTLSASCTLPITHEAPPRTLAVRTADAPRYAPTRPEAVALVVGRAQAKGCETLGVVAIRDSLRPALVEFSFLGGIHRIDGRSTRPILEYTPSVDAGSNVPRR